MKMSPGSAGAQNFKQRDDDVRPAVRRWLLRGAGGNPSVNGVDRGLVYLEEQILSYDPADLTASEIRIPADTENS
jgi:hypothetical protein